MSLLYRRKGIKLFTGDFANELHNLSGVDLFLTSPPYNIGSKCKKKVNNRRNGGFDSKSFQSITEYPDCLPEDIYQQWQHDTLVWMSERLSTNGVILYNHKARHVNGQLIKPEVWFPDPSQLILRDEIVWNRGSTHNHTPVYAWQQHEYLYVFTLPGSKPYFKNQEFEWIARGKRGVGSVWDIPKETATHNAPMPLKLATHAVKLWSRPGALVCDPFSGGGTTMIASYNEGRKFIGSEKMKVHAVESVKRFKQIVSKS